MNEERMAVLRMLEKGIINADEAERLIVALSQPSKNDDTINHIGIMIDKAGEALTTLAKNINERAKEAEPVIKRKVNDITDKAMDIKDEISAYKERKRKAFEEFQKREEEQKQELKKEFKEYENSRKKSLSDEMELFNLLNENFDDNEEAMEPDLNLTQEAYLKTIEEMLKSAEENSDFMEKMQSACGGDYCNDCDSCKNCNGKSFEDRVICGRTEPCCGENGFECRNDEPCCDDETICHKEVYCCGLTEDCGKLSPCCWDDEGKEFAKNRAKEYGTQVGDFIVKNPKSENNIF